MIPVTFIAAIAAFPSVVNSVATGFKSALERRGFDCGKPADGLTQDDCEYMSSIGMAGQGVNAKSPAPNINIWIGDQGPSKLIFTNAGSEPVIVIVWDFPKGDYQASFMNARRPKVSFSLPKHGDSVSVSMGNGVSGGWSALVNRKTRLSANGQIDNTWGEFTSGEHATVDISRLINMSGSHMVARTKGGCTTGMDKCVFLCKAGNTCWEAGSYILDKCGPGSQPGANYGVLNGNPEGGCQGWENGGHVNVELGKPA
ncbi:putative effector 5 [Metarhizium album ARSEF 1941]|uniref:Putative effector 5 n=1 Tax=Metarhizium album (strain ARSEF 1941) TaxID=1081103 RepID=A0A0B2WKC9_METAS|nr:putative effector 5 [Metarhizium album ARSEF 1941]KHN93932.1 putative effector 5 [Metarhizium album ARSEF 1941]